MYFPQRPGLDPRYQELATNPNRFFETKLTTKEEKILIKSLKNLELQLEKEPIWFYIVEKIKYILLDMRYEQMEKLKINYRDFIEALKVYKFSNAYIIQFTEQFNNYLNIEENFTTNRRSNNV